MFYVKKKTFLFHNVQKYEIAEHVDNFYCKPINSSYAEETGLMHLKLYDKHLMECNILDGVNIAEINDHFCNASNEIKKICDSFDKSLDVVYSVKINVDKILMKLKLNEENLIFEIEKFEKVFDSYLEIDTKTLSRIYFSKENNYTLYLNKYGYYQVNLYKKSNRQIPFYRDYYFIFPYKMSDLMHERNNYKDLLKKENFFPKKTFKFNDNNSNNKKMNVLMLLIDSLSSQHIKRIMPLTYDYLINQLENNILYTMFNSVGENTYPNIVPLYSGVVVHPIDSANVTSEIDKYNTEYDRLPFVWYDYEEAGYLSGFQQDCPLIGAFNFNRYGFKYKPTGFYGRPFWVRKYDHSQEIGFCDRGRSVLETQMTLLENFLKRMHKNDINSNTPYFLFNFLGEYTHHYFNVPSFFDKYFLDKFKKFESEGYFDNTLFIFHGDHGHRISKFSRTNIGKSEKKLPFLSLRMPKALWNTDYYRNAKRNKNKLITLYDLHKTLRHFLYINIDKKINDNEFSKSETSKPHLRGISIFENIPLNRSCTDALIPDNFCSCITHSTINEQDFFNETNKQVSEVGNYIVKHINSITSKYRNICKEYKFDWLYEIRRQNIINKKRYDFTIVVQPGDAIFEATVNINNDKYEVYDEVIRMNRYGPYSKCINNVFIKRYCYCY